MADKFLAVNNTTGNIKEVEATVVSTGAPEAGDLVALNASGKLDESVMPTGVGADVSVVPASENLASGDFVNLWDDSGTVKARKADASASKAADGFVTDAVTSGSNATVYHEGSNDGLTSLTLAAKYFLSAATPGAVTTTPPTGSGNLVQFLGKATATTTIAFEASTPIERA